ncbi:MAG TPA: hypothetical protein VJV79_04205 [Polyangiaceae bacterium]|nr:hypothetical protein [Polyangiaceae bacterium]
MRSALVLSAVALASALASGCDKQEKQRDSENASDAGTSKASKVAADEPDLAKAMGSVAAARSNPAAATAGGPPPTGIFGEGEADKAAAKGAPASLTVGSEGSEPRVLLGGSLKPGTKRTGTVDVATQSDPQQGAIPIQFAVTLEALKPKVEGDAKAKAEGAAALPAPTQIVVKITSARINAPGVPADLANAVSKLKGSRVEYQVGADGTAGNLRNEIPKGVDPGFRDPVQALSDLLVGVALPFPSKPVGLGSYWMVTSRDVVMGLDVVTYRMVKVEKIEGTAVSLSVNTKRYAASPAFEIEGLPADAPKLMSEFRAGGEGKISVLAGEVVPTEGELQSMIGAALGPADAKQRPMVQVQTRASFHLTPAP